MVLSIRSMLTEFFCGLNALITMQMLSAKRWIGVRYANRAFSLDGSWDFLFHRICIRPLHARTGQVSVADKHSRSVIYQG